ncbi:MAG: DUF4363 family protein [Eubacteriales bacterium]|nr:DUF4363 family protein [Eubacteriales bacterium]
MKKIIAVLIPAVFIVFFILIMISSSYLKQSFREDDNVPVIIDAIKEDVDAGDWSEAKEGADELETAWKIIMGRVQFSAARDELRDAKTSIVRMKAYIEANDRAGSLAELNEVKEHWTYIGE